MGIQEGVLGNSRTLKNNKGLAICGVLSESGPGVAGLKVEDSDSMEF